MRIYKYVYVCVCVCVVCALKKDKEYPKFTPRYIAYIL